MANYSTLKTAVADVVKTNGSQAITGANLQSVLLSIINSVGGGYIFKGVATPSTSAGTPDQNVFYIAGAGTYANFGTSVVVPPTNIAVFKYDGTWTCEQVMVENGGVFDISAFKAVGGTLATYADLASALGTNGANIPVGVRKGGMSIKFVQSSDNKYVQYRLVSPTWSTDIHDWTSEDPYFIDKIMQEVNEAIDENTPIEIHGDVNNAPDEEDLTSVNVEGTDVLKFKDKAYNSLTYSGMGRKILRKNIVDGVNTLTQSMINQANTIYVIQYDFTLGEDITVPANCILKFEGGSISNGTIIGQNTCVEAPLVQIFRAKISLEGTWNVADAYPEWFGAKGDGITDDTICIAKALSCFQYVCLGDKSYKVSGTLDIVQGKTIKGVSADDTTIVFSGEEPCFLIHDNFGTICNLTIHCSNTEYESSLIKISDDKGNNDHFPIIKNIKLYYTENCVHEGNLKENCGITFLSDRTTSESLLYGLYNAQIDNVDFWYCRVAIEMKIQNGGWINSNYIKNCRVHSCPTAVRTISSSGTQLDYNEFQFTYQNSHLVLAGEKIFDFRTGRNNIIDCFPWDLRYDGLGSILGSARDCFNKTNVLSTFFNQNYYIFLGTLKPVGQVEITMVYGTSSRNSRIWSTSDGLFYRGDIIPYYKIVDGEFYIFIKGNGNWGSIMISNYHFFLFAGAQNQIEPSDSYTEELIEGTAQPLPNGEMSYNNDVKQPIWWNGNKWRDAYNQVVARRRGTTAQRPTVDSFVLEDNGFKYFDTDLNRDIYAELFYSGTTLKLRWIDEDGFTAVRKRGTTAQRPTDALILPNDLNYPYYDTDINQWVYFAIQGSSKTWISNRGFTPGRKAGTTEQRPNNLTTYDVGYLYFDTTLGKPIWWTSSAWVDATGTTV